MPVTPPLDALRTWLTHQRWYGEDADSDIDVTCYPLGEPGTDTVIGLIRVGGDATYHVPLRRSVDADEAGVISTNPPWSDAVASAEGAATLLQAFSGRSGPVAGEWLAAPPRTERAWAPGGDHSNSAILIGEDHFVKVLRRVHPGVNPEVEVGRALRASGSEHTPRYVGSLVLHGEGAPITLAVAHEQLRGTDGFTLARRDVDRDRGGRAGEHFPGAAYELGIAVGAVHDDLLTAFGGDEVEGSRQLFGRRMLTRLAALQDIPELAPYLATARMTFERIAAADGRAARQRIHGDLHLGQVIFTDTGWRLVDFEGEPRRPLAERVAPDSPMRDLAGIVRSFDYAALWAGRYDGGAAWRDRAVEMFIEGYRLQQPEVYDADLLDAFVLDKALYEVGYERAYRPEHTGIPLSAVARLAGGSHPEETGS